jgi:hypothetical protein
MHLHFTREKGGYSVLLTKSAVRSVIDKIVIIKNLKEKLVLHLFSIMYEHCGFNDWMHMSNVRILLKREIFSSKN